MKISGNVANYACLFIGILLLTGSLLSYRNTEFFLAEARSTEGTVIEMVQRHSSSGRHRHRSNTYAPVVQFEVPNHDGVIVFTSSSSTNPPAYKVGEAIEVLYPVEAPEQARVNSFFSLWGVSTILGAMGGGFAFIGLISAGLRHLL